MATSSGPCAPCQDSGLSITGNVIGILTFAYVLFVGLSYRASSIRRATSDLEILYIELQLRGKEFESWDMALKALGNQWYNNSHLSTYLDAETLQAKRDALDGARAAYIRAAGQKKDLDNQIGEEGRASAEGVLETRSLGNFWLRFWFGIRFVMEKDEAREGMERFTRLLELSKALAPEAPPELPVVTEKESGDEDGAAKQRGGGLGSMIRRLEHMLGKEPVEVPKDTKPDVMFQIQYLRHLLNVAEQDFALASTPNSNLSDTAGIRPIGSGPSIVGGTLYQFTVRNADLELDHESV